MTEFRFFSYLLLGLLMPQFALAGVYSVSSPDIKAGVAGFETSIALEQDSNRADDNLREYVIEAEYGITEYWGVDIEATAERSADHSLQYKVTDLKSTLQFIERDSENPFSAGIMVEYKIPSLDDEADEINARLIVRHKGRNTDSIFHFGGEREVGKNSGDQTYADIRASFGYIVNENLKTALDYLGKSAAFHEIMEMSKHDHRIGPVVYGDMDHGFEYQLGYLAGISDDAPDHSFKMSLGYNF